MQHQTQIPLVSVIMSVYNESQQQIHAAATGILEQSYEHLEFIIILDNPENAVAKRYLSELAQKNPKVTLLINEKNIRLGASLNKGIAHAKGAYIARMDADDTCYFEDRIVKQVAHMENNPEVDLLFTWWEEKRDGKVIEKRTPSATLTTKMKQSFFRHAMLLHPTVMAKKEVFDNNHYPETDRPEDLILFLQLIRKNYTFDIFEEVLYTYTVDAVNTEARYKKIRAYSQTWLPHLIKQIPHFFLNIFFWMYLLRITVEFLTSRNQLVFALVHETVSDIVRTRRR